MARIFLSADELARLDDSMRARAADQGDGNFLLEHDIAEGQSLAFQSVEALTRSLEAARGEVRKERDKLKAFKDIDPAEARTALEKYAEMQNWNPDEEVKAKTDALLEQARRKHAEELDKERQNSSGLQSQLSKLLISDAAQKALAKHGGAPHLLLPHVQSCVRMRRDDAGNQVAEVFDPVTDHPRVATGDPTSSMSIDQLVAEMKTKPEFAVAFQGTGQTGSGGSTAPAFGGGQPAPSTRAAPPAGGVRTIDYKDIGGNLEAVAKGDVQVNIPSEG